MFQSAMGVAIAILHSDAAGLLGLPQGFCPEQHRLRLKFVEAVHKISDLQTQQIGAVIGGDEDFGYFEDLLEAASRDKDRAKYALIHHFESHHC